jgi:peptidyl-prolyl cis-trans isomerase SurA
MKNLAYIVALLLLFPGFVTADTPQTATYGEGIAATVNGNIITFLEISRADYAKDVEYRQQFQGDVLRDKLKELKIKTGNELIDDMLIVEDFRRTGGFTPESYVEQQVQGVIKDQYQGDEDRFTRVLAAYGETLDEYKTLAENQAIVVFMTKKNVEDKLTATGDAPRAEERETLRAKWIASLREKAFIKTTW